MKMTILERDDGIAHVVLAGRLDTSGTEEIGEAFSEATTAIARPAVVDLSEIAFLASRGIGLLFANGKKLMKAGHRMVLVNPTGMVHSVLKTSRIDVVLPIAGNLEEALEILQMVHDQPDAKTASPTVSDHPSPTPRSEPVVAAQPLHEGEMKQTVKNELSELDGLNANLARFLDEHGVPYKAAYAVKLAIDELVVNVMRYAYVDDDPHFIDIELAVESEQVILRIVDDGRPFDPRTGPSLDLHAEDREVGGLGLILVLDMVDVLDYQRVGERNHVEVRVHIIADDQIGDSSTGEPHNVQ